MLGTIGRDEIGVPGRGVEVARFFVVGLGLGPRRLLGRRFLGHHVGLLLDQLVQVLSSQTTSSHQNQKNKKKYNSSTSTLDQLQLGATALTTPTTVSQREPKKNEGNLVKGERRSSKLVKTLAVLICLRPKRVFSWMPGPASPATTILRRIFSCSVRRSLVTFFFLRFSSLARSSSNSWTCCSTRASSFSSSSASASASSSAAFASAAPAGPSFSCEKPRTTR